jgi:RND family efflux transporter MFP subunit
MRNKRFKAETFDLMYRPRFPHLDLSSSAGGFQNGGGAGGGTKKRSKTKLGIVLMIGLVVLIGMGIIGVGVGRHMLRTSPTLAKKFDAPLPVQVVEAKLTDLTEIVGATGAVQPLALIKLTTKMAGRIEKIAVDLGDLTTTGQLLIQLDRAVPTAVLRASQSAVEQTAAELSRTTQQLRRVKGFYEQGLSNALLRTAHSAVETAQSELDRAVQYLQRIQAIHEQGLLPRFEVEKAQAKVDEAQLRYNESTEKLLQVQKDLQSEVEKAQAKVDEAKFQYSDAEKKLVQAKEDLQHTTLVSPVPGIIMERLINVGEVSRVEQHLLTIGQIDQVLIEAKIAEERVGDVHLKQSATVTFDAFPHETFEGEVVKIKPVTDPETRTFLAYIKVANPELKLKPGLTGFVRITRKRHVLAVPSIAVINPTGVRESTVFVVDNKERATLRRVKVGIAAEGMTEILDGLTPGENVVVVGQFHLRDGAQVRVGDEFNEIKAKFAKQPQPDSISAAEIRGSSHR